MKNISFKVGDLPTLIEKHTNQVFCLEREVPQKQQTIKLEEAIKLVTIDANDNSKVVKIGGSLDRIIRETLIAFLKSNKNVFAWTYEDMPGISPDHIMHSLNVNPDCLPVKQKKRTFNQERNEAIQVEVEKLLKVGFIREVLYPDWFSNMVCSGKQTDSSGYV